MAEPTPPAAPNPAERKRWNDDRWVAAWLQREPLTLPMTPILLDALALRAGERVVEIGCGGGLTTLDCARTVGPTGSVLGVDISDALVRLARERAESARVDNATFVVADAQADDFPGAPFDVATSKLGVMFFDDPGRAFANIRAGLRPGGRLAFARFQSMPRNPWHTGATIRPFTAAGEQPPNPQAPGPFSLGDPIVTNALLADAGFADIERRDMELTVRAAASEIHDKRALETAGVAPERVPAADAAVTAHLAQFQVGPDEYEFPLAFSICTATNPAS